MKWERAKGFRLMPAASWVLGLMLGGAMLGSCLSRVGLLAVSVLLVGVPVAGLAGPAGADFHGGGGNSGYAHTCNNDGWQLLVRADQTQFTNGGDCTSYLAQGGSPILAPSNLLCAAYGGTFVAGSGKVLWSCNGLPVITAEEEEGRSLYMGISCWSDGGNQLAWSNYPTAPYNWTCTVF